MKISRSHSRILKSGLLVIALLVMSLPAISCGSESVDVEAESQAMNEFTLRLSMADGNDVITDDVVSEVIDVISRRLDPVNSGTCEVVADGEDRIKVRVPVDRDVDAVSYLVTHHGADLKFIDMGSESVPEGSEIRMIDPETGAEINGSEIPEGIMGITADHVILTGEDFENAAMTLDQMGHPQIEFEFKPEGRDLFGRHTSTHVGMYLAIVLDNRVISCPVIREPIIQGRGVISGNFMRQEAEELSLMLNSGKLPVSVEIESVRNTGGTDESVEPSEG